MVTQGWVLSPDTLSFSGRLCEIGEEEDLLHNLSMLLNLIALIRGYSWR